jgi:L-lactate dehydrogenase (cytochrome)
MKAASVYDYRRLARKRVPHFLFEYLDGGSYAEVTKGRNRADLESLALRQRILRDVSDIDTTIELFGHDFQMPVGLAPVGLAGMYARRGELQAVRAAEAAGVPFTLSTVGVCPIGEVAEVATRPFWFQLYMIRDRAFMRDMLALAREAGCSALVFTVDMPVPGSRYRDYRSGRQAAPTWQCCAGARRKKRPRGFHGLDAEKLRPVGIVAGPRVHPRQLGWTHYHQGNNGPG